MSQPITKGYSMGKSKKHKKRKVNGNGQHPILPFSISLFALAKLNQIHPAGIVKILTENGRGDQINKKSGAWRIPAHEDVHSNEDAVELFCFALGAMIYSMEDRIFICRDCCMITIFNQEAFEHMPPGTTWCEYCSGMLTPLADEFNLDDGVENGTRPIAYHV